MENKYYENSKKIIKARLDAGENLAEIMVEYTNEQIRLQNGKSEERKDAHSQLVDMLVKAAGTKIISTYLFENGWDFDEKTGFFYKI